MRFEEEMENAQHSDFILDQMHNKIVEMESQTQNATKLDDQFITSVIGNHIHCHFLLGNLDLHTMVGPRPSPLPCDLG